MTNYYQPPYNNLAAAPQYNQQQQIIPALQQPQLNPNQLPSVGVYWVQGLEGAKGYQLPTANTSVYLRDSDDNSMLYIKSTDASGRPGSLQAYKLQEVPIEPHTTNEDKNYITADILDEMLDDKLEKMFRKYSNNNQGGKRNNGSKRNNNNNRGEYNETE